MKIFDIFSFSFGAIRKRKLRAGLTTLGVIIGITAIVALLALGQGFENEINTQFELGFSTNALIVTSGGYGTTSDFSLYANDSNYITALANVSHAVAILQHSAIIKVNGQERIVTIVGVNYADYAAIYSSTFVASMGKIPETGNNESIVIGWGIYDPYNNGTTFATVNDSISIIHQYRVENSTQLLNRTYTGMIAGVLGEVGGFSIGGPSDTTLYMPIEEAMQFFDDNTVNTIVVQVTEDNDAVRESVTAAIKALFNDNVSVIAPVAILGVISQVLGVVELFLAGIAGISLMVAGIGIMNIMIVSLMERTREIGILKALGMKNYNVLLIFLSEAAIIGFLGGLIGVSLGYLVAILAGRVFAAVSGSGGGFGFSSSTQVSGTFSITPVVSPQLAFIAIGFGLVVSVIFALYPAWRASRLEPVDALRYE